MRRPTLPAVRRGRRSPGSSPCPPHLPVPIPAAIALRQAVAALLAVIGTSPGAALHVHRPLDCKAARLAQQIGIGVQRMILPPEGSLVRVTFDKHTQVHHRFGHDLASRAMRGMIPRGG